MLVSGSVVFSVCGLGVAKETSSADNFANSKEPDELSAVCQVGDDVVSGSELHEQFLLLSGGFEHVQGTLVNSFEIGSGRGSHGFLFVDDLGHLGRDLGPIDGGVTRLYSL